MGRKKGVPHVRRMLPAATASAEDLDGTWVPSGPGPLMVVRSVFDPIGGTIVLWHPVDKPDRCAAIALMEFQAWVEEKGAVRER
jgi:hypothetical protein